MKIVLLLITVSLLLGSTLFSVHGESGTERKEYVTIIPEKSFKRSGFHNFFFGKHWRTLWTTAIKVEVLDLDTFAGGLTPVKKGGGFQTKSLRFLGKDGSYWKFRSVNKDPKSVLPKEFQETFAAKVLKDQISGANPFAPLVAVPILNAVGILQARPKLVYLKDDPKLGKFRKDFANMLGMIELHPTNRDRDSGQFKDVKKIIGTEKLFRRLEKKREEKVDSREYLKARLIDIFLGDWDRHVDQWRWAKYKQDEGSVWRPIPRDRDQVFAKFDGILPAITAHLVIHLSHFARNYTSIRQITWSGRYLDRRYLPELDRKTWKEVTRMVQSRLTDQVIVDAVKQLPAEAYEKVGSDLIDKLKHRRNKLGLMSDKYYRMINRVVDLFCSDRRDFVEIERLDNRWTRIDLYKRSKKTGKKKGRSLYHKRVDGKLTSEIRVYLNDGNDQVVVTGVVDRGPKIRVIGGKGKDHLINKSKVKGKFLAITPITINRQKTFFYDSGKKTIIQKVSGTSVSKRKVKKPKTMAERYEPLQKNRGKDFYIYPQIGFNSYDGLQLGFGSFYNRYGFRYAPYKYRLNFNASYTSGSQHSAFHFNGIFNHLIHGISIHLDVMKSRLQYGDYFGYGNDTTLDESLDDEDFYHSVEDYFIFKPSLHFKLSKRGSGALGIAYRRSDVALNQSSLLALFPLGDYGMNNYDSIELNGALRYDSRDNVANPYRGIFFRIVATHFPKLMDNKHAFTRGEFDIRSYLRLRFITDSTIAFRIGGSKLWGRFPFYQAAFLGGGTNLRGYNRNRFSGDAMLFGQLELRSYLAPVFIVIPARMGLHLFADAGRVFNENIDSDTWHSSYGGGLWLSFTKRMATAALSLAKSSEKLMVYVTLKFMF